MFKNNEQTLKKLMNEINKKDLLKRYFWLIVGCFIFSFGFNVFFLQYDLVCTGISGLSIVLQNFINPSKLILFINIFLLILSYFLLGFEKTKNSIIGSLLLPIFISLTEKLVPFFNLANLEIMVIAIFGAVFTSLGIGIVFKNGFTTGGTDIINQIVSKYTKISIGNAMLIVDGLIVLSAKLVFSWETVLYGFIILYIMSVIIDKVILGISQSKAFYIVSEKEDEVRNFLLSINNAGLTVLNVKGGYSNEKHLLLLAVIPTRNYFIVKEGLKAIDKDVFFLVCDAYEVFKKEGKKDVKR